MYVASECNEAEIGDAMKDYTDRRVKALELAVSVANTKAHVSGYFVGSDEVLEMAQQFLGFIFYEPKKERL